MGVPASQIPGKNSFCVHAFGKPGSLAWTTAVDAADALLKSAKVPVLSLDIHAIFTGSEIGTAPLVAVEWDYLLQRERTASLASLTKESLLIALAYKYDLLVPPADLIQIPDLWLVSDGKGNVESLAREWSDQGAKAVAVFGYCGSACWTSRNAAFGNSGGILKKSFLAFSDIGLGFFAGGIIYSLIEELLGESLFDKTAPRLDRECLEMRPLHLMRAVEAGFAVASIHAGRTSAGQNAIKQPNFLLGRMRAVLRSWRGPEPQGWGSGR